MATEKTAQQINREMDELKKDLRKLKTDLAGMVGAVGNLSQEKAMHGKSRLKDAWSGLEGRTKERMDTAHKVVRERGDEAIHKSRRAISSKPLASVLISFAVGAVIAGIFGMGRRS